MYPRQVHWLMHIPLASSQVACSNLWPFGTQGWIGWQPFPSTQIHVYSTYSRDVQLACSWFMFLLRKIRFPLCFFGVLSSQRLWNSWQKMKYWCSHHASHAPWTICVFVFLNSQQRNIKCSRASPHFITISPRWFTFFVYDERQKNPNPPQSEIIKFFDPWLCCLDVNLLFDSHIYSNILSIFGPAWRLAISCTY